MGVKVIETSMKAPFMNIEVRSSYEDGHCDCRTVSVADYVRSMKSATETSTQRRIGQLPAGFYDGQIGEEINTFSAAVILPAQKRIISYFGEAHLVPFPDMAMFVKAEAGRPVVTKMFALERYSGERFVSGSSMVRRYPFGNVYADGKICWGSNVIKNLESMKDLEYLAGLFLGSDTNMDLYHACKEEFSDQKGLIIALEERDEFPKEWLTPIAGQKKLDDMVEEFFK